VEYVPRVMEGSINIDVFGKFVEIDLCEVPVYQLAMGKRTPPRWYLQASAVIVCFAIDDIASLKDVEETWVPLPENRDHYSGERTMPLLLVGCKRDVRANGGRLHGHKDHAPSLVSTEQ
ncbi:hypothetical protein FRC17_004072, partial [Serendipita sp. 399]